MSQVEGHKANVAIMEIKGGMDPPSTNEEEAINKEWQAEARALDHISGLNHRNIIQRIAAIKRGKERYFMFEWADGGSLGDFWKDNPRPNLDPGFIKEIVMQLRELADALHELHNYEGSYRHGDLKPENILRFKDATRVGVLKIAGMGLVRWHTDMSYTSGTARYEPPEVVTFRRSEESRSRLYDIWSMGCITLEIIVWLLYGYHDLMKFNDSIKSSVEESSPYFKVGNDNVAEVHPVVQACIDHIFKDPECTSNGGNIAIRDLLNIVKTNLLVVHTPRRRALNLASIGGNVAVTDTGSRPSPTYRPIDPTRATASHFRKLLDDMIGKGKEDERYWFTGISREKLKGPPSRMISSTVTNDFLSPESAYRPNQLADRIARRRDTPTQPALSMQLAPSSTQNVSILLPTYQSTPLFVLPCDC
jgi:serine/threonine protein kinase